MSEQAVKRPKDWREARRMRAWELKQAGWKQKAIAEALGVSQAAVSTWMQRAEEGGPEALRRQPRQGSTRRLTDEQLARLPGLLSQGAEAFGFRGAVWTRGRVANVIQREFGVAYSPRHAGRLLNVIGWSSQKPVARASQRDEVAIARWREETWPQLQKKPSRKAGQ